MLRKKSVRPICPFNQKLLWGVQGGGFLEKSPPGGRRQISIIRVIASDLTGGDAILH
jgi:hypothetical protein